MPTNADAGMQTGTSLLLALMYQLVHGGGLGTATVRLSPVAYAGWIGLFVTALNLMPVGQLMEGISRTDSWAAATPGRSASGPCW